MCSSDTSRSKVAAASDRRYRYSGGNWLRKRSVSRQHSLSIANAIVSELSGGTVSVSAGNDLLSQGTLFSGTEAVNVSGVNSQRFYSAQNVQQSSDNEQISSGLFGITLSKKTVTDQQSSSVSIASTLLSTEKINIDVGNEASFYGANLSADQINFYQSDTSKAGQLILGGSIDSTQSSHTEKSGTAGLWQAMSGHGSSIETLNQTQLTGNVSFDNGLKITAQIPQGDLQTQVAALGAQGGLTAQTGDSAVSSVNQVATSQAANQFSQNLLKNVVNNLAGSVIAAGINGQALNETTLTSALTNALITAGMASGANAIGDAATATGTEAAKINAFTQDLAHAILGCAGGTAMAGNSGGCAPGAVGAVVGELAAQYINPSADPALKEQTLAFAKTMSAIAGVLVGGGDDNVTAVNVAATAGANAAENNQLTHSKNILSLASQCGAGQPPCSDEKIQAINQAEGMVNQAALANMKAVAPYAAGTAVVVALGPEAITGAILAGAFDYGGDTLSKMMGLSNDSPSLSKSYTTGIIAGAMLPLAISDKVISGVGTAGKVAANGYNALVSGTSAFGAAVYTDQDSPGTSAATTTIASGLGSAVKSSLPAPLGNALNQMIQGATGPVQSAIQYFLEK
jgi:filamentous hemagglutinin